MSRRHPGPVAYAVLAVLIAGAFGMVQFGPDTPSRPGGGAYSATGNQITGLNPSHLSGPGCYATTPGQVRTEPTATSVGGLARLTCPPTTQAQLLVKVADSQDGSVNVIFRTIGHRRIAGSVDSGQLRGRRNSATVHVAARLDRSFTASDPRTPRCPPRAPWSPPRTTRARPPCLWAAVPRPSAGRQSTLSRDRR